MRTCGECTACCTALAVVELDKPRYQSCAHLSGRGCGNYEHRPGPCRDYQCLWLQGFLEDEHRPDRLGVIFTVTRDPDRPHLGNMPMLVEYTDGALEQPHVREAIRQFAQQKPVALITRTGLSVIPTVQLTVNGHAA